VLPTSENNRDISRVISGGLHPAAEGGTPSYSFVDYRPIYHEQSRKR